jgi:hypothetical protein
MKGARCPYYSLEKYTIYTAIIRRVYGACGVLAVRFARHWLLSPPEHCIALGLDFSGM